MATEKDAAKGSTPTETPPDWRKPTTFGSFIRDVVIAALVLGAALYVYKARVDKGKRIRELGKEAKILVLKDNPKDLADAEAKLKEVVALDASYGFAVASLGQLYGIRWNDLGLEADGAAAKEWTKKAEELDTRIAERYGAAMLARLGDRNWADAEAYGTEISKQAATSTVVNGLGRAFRAQAKLDQAQQALKKAADTEWRNPRFQCDFADFYLDAGDFANAESFYQKGLDSNSEHIRSQIGFARARIGRGKHIEAKESLQKLLSNPDVTGKLKANVLTGLAEAHLVDGNFDEALKAADEAIAAFAAYPWAHHVKGRALAGKKDTSAIASFDKALELDPNAPVFYYVASDAALALEDGAHATGYLDAYAKRLKEDDKLHVVYGNALRKLGKHDEALQRFEKAIEAGGFSVAQALYSKAALLLDDKNDIEKAKATLDQALAVQEIFPDAHAKVGDVFFAKKEFVEGAQSFATALSQMKLMQMPKEKMNALRDGVAEKLNKAGKKDIAKLWLDESQNLIR